MVKCFNFLPLADNDGSIINDPAPLRYNVHISRKLLEKTCFIFVLTTVRVRCCDFSRHSSTPAEALSAASDTFIAIPTPHDSALGDHKIWRHKYSPTHPDPTTSIMTSPKVEYRQLGKSGLRVSVPIVSFMQRAAHPLS